MKMTKTELAVRQIRDYIGSMNLKPGDRIPTQKELCEILGTSIRPLREGVNLLIRQGMLTSNGRAGTYISNPKETSVVEPIKWYFESNDVEEEELITARALLEAAIIQQACKKRTTKDLLLLQQLIDAQAEPGNSAKQELEYDKRFHLQLMSCAHNKVFQIVANVILLQFEVIYKHDLYPNQDKIRVEDHQKILDAIFERDVSKASEMIQTHIMRSYELKRRYAKT
jgi:GntR family transcriptional regulator, transcriptional repressor for pyruvate dehydrogenase complex